MGYYRLHVQLNEDEPNDQVVIAALERLGSRGKSAWVRRVLYEAVTGPARDEILDEIREIKATVQRLEQNGVAIKSGQDSDQDGEPEQARAGLNAMIAQFREV